MTSTELTAQQQPGKLVVHDSSATSYLMDTAKFEHCYRIAKAMATASLLPDHLRTRNKQALSHEEIAGNCFRIVNQALRWNMDPFALVDETYVVGNKLGYQGKLVAAVVNARAGLAERLRYEFTGSGDGRTVTVIGTFRGESNPRMITLSVGQAKTDNKMWRNDPDQKLVYSGVTKWARRHCPEIMLGVLTDDDLERIDRAAEAAAIVAPQSLDQLAGQILARAALPAEEPHTDGDGEVIDEAAQPEADCTQSQDAPPDFDEHEAVMQEWYAEIAECSTLTAVNDVVRKAQALEEPLKARVLDLCEAQASAIRSARGGKQKEFSA